MYTNKNMNEVVSESKAVKHSHLPKHKEFQIRKVQQKIKAQARDTEETTSQIILNALPELSKEALPVAPSQDALARMIQRSRYKKPDMREEPTNFFQLVLQEGDKITTENQNFLLFDSAAEGVDDENRRLIMWATEENMEFLSKSH